MREQRKEPKENAAASDVFVFGPDGGEYLVRPADFVTHNRKVRFRNFTAWSVTIELQRRPEIPVPSQGGPRFPDPLPIAAGGRETLEIPELVPAGVYGLRVWVHSGLKEWVRAIGHSSPRIIIDP